MPEVQVGGSRMQHGEPEVHNSEFEAQQYKSEQFEANFSADIDATECKSKTRIELETDHPVEQEDYVDDMRIDSLDPEKDDEYEDGILEKFNTQNMSRRKYYHG